MLRSAFLRIALTVLMSAGAMIGSAAIGQERWAYIDVVGAPGDGKEALENALSSQLLNRGFTVTGTPAAQAYEIQGMVRLLPAGRGEETIRIDWTVFGPEGLRLGNVTQTNVIPEGSLNRRWGPAAEAAASAAAHDIMQYIAQ